MARILCTLLAVLSLTALADELHVGAVSYHFDRDDKWCESNPLLGYTSDEGVSGIVFRNSLCNWTAFFNRKYAFWEAGPVELAARGGVYWSEEEYILGQEIGPAATLELTLFDKAVISYLGEAVSLHITHRY